MLSIVVPVYNGEKYLDECFKSLENQTNSKFEIVLVDDGSTDTSGHKCDEFAGTHHGVEVVHTENQGLLLARRTGIVHSKGDYLAFLDSDDCISPDFVYEVEKVISEQNEPDIIVFDFSRGASPTYNGLIIKPGLSRSGRYTEEDFTCIKKALCEGMFNNMANKVIKKSVIGTNDDYSSFRGLMHGEDWLQMIPIVDRAGSAFYINRPLYFYRISSQSSTHSFKVSQLYDLSRVFERLLNVSEKWGQDLFQCARLGACKHIFMLISALAATKDYSAKDKIMIMDEIADLIRFVCRDESNAIFPKLRIDYSLALRFALGKKPQLSMFTAYLSVGLYNKLNRIAHE